MNQYLIPLNDDMYESIDDFILEQCTYYGDENNCKFETCYFCVKLTDHLDKYLHRLNFLIRELEFLD